MLCLASFGFCPASIALAHALTDGVHHSPRVCLSFTLCCAQTVAGVPVVDFVMNLSADFSNFAQALINWIRSIVSFDPM